MSKSHIKNLKVDARVTIHFRNPKSKILLEALAERDNAKSLSSWLADIVENEIIPNKLNGGKQ